KVLRAQRAFVRRAVSSLTGRGVTQFLAIGCGLPTRGNVHEIAGEATTSARVVYVDADPVAVAHTRLIRPHPGGTLAGWTRADGQPRHGAPAPRALPRRLSFRQPVAVVLADALHTVPREDDPARMRRFSRSSAKPAIAQTSRHGKRQQAARDCQHPSE